ncbi:MAG TPA: UvrD-helicase domain-containing protein [Coriobacteriia bacterium]|nr:UvrD-helicase domain-containing protein [Coriobacteriia bacterium]
MNPQFTPDQRRVIDTLEGDVAVMAGAGSGKTTVLAHRFASAMSTPVKGKSIPVDGVLTITFTNKAAGEIGERVRRVVARELSPAKGRETERAWISTIHALCSRLLRRHLLESGVNPAFGLVDEATAQALSAEAYETAVLEMVEKDASTAELVDSFGVNALRTMVTRCHDEIRAMGLSPADVQIGWDAGVISEMRLKLALAADVYIAALEDASPTPKRVEAASYLADWASSLHACDLNCDTGWSDLAAVCSAYSLSAPSGTREHNDALKAALAELKHTLRALESERLVGAVADLVVAYADTYRALKEARSVLDYDDLQERAVAMLEANPAMAARYRRQFDLVMVDEFQDTNELQMRVLRQLVDHNLCVVGDERQSIYGWRYADVSIFRELARRADTPIELKANFRSHPAVLCFVNELFSMPHLFGPSFMRLDAGRAEQPVFPLAEDEPRVEVLLVDYAKPARVADAVALEAQEIARRARCLLDEGSPDLEPGDIAVLVRAGTHAARYAEALEAEGLPVVLSAGAALFDAPEVAHVMAMLRAIAVPADDEALLTLLAGPLVGVSDDALLETRRQARVAKRDGQEALWDGVKACAEGAGEMDTQDRRALARCRQVIDHFGVRYGAMSLSELVLTACEAFDFDITLSTQGPDGTRAWSNVLKIARTADAFEATGSKDPARLAEYLKLCQEHSKANPAPSESGGQSVRVMTIHASKGLEFPVVFVAGLKVPKHGTADNVLVEAAEGESGQTPRIAVRMPESVLDGACTPDYPRLRDAAIVEEEEEEKRALYVACTRARELLVLSAPLESDKGTMTIDWVRAGLAEEADGVTRVGEAPVRVTLLEATAPAVEAVNVAPKGGTDGPLVSGEFAVPATPGPARLPSAVSYSALHLHQTCPLAFHARYALGMRAFEPEGASRATEIGSATHARLQAWADDIEWNEVRAEALARRFSLDEAEMRRVEAATGRFTRSEIGVRVAAAPRRQAEVAFRVALDGTVLHGAIDLIAWAGERALIADYKTGRAPDRGSSRMEGYELQARCYALAALEHGASSAEVDFVFVDHDVEPVKFVFEAQKAAALKDGLNAIVAEIREQPLTHLACYEEQTCKGCPAYRTLCPIEGPADTGAA